MFNNRFDNQFPSQFGPSLPPVDTPFGPRLLNPIDQPSFSQFRPGPLFNDLPTINAPGPLGPAVTQPFGPLPYDNSPYFNSFGSQFGPPPNQPPFIDELPPVNAFGPQPGSLPPVFQNPFNGNLPPINYGPQLGPKPQYPAFLSDLPSLNQFGPGGAPPVPPFRPNYNEYSPFDSSERASAVPLPSAPVIPQASLFPASYPTPVLGSPALNPFNQQNPFVPSGYSSVGYLPPVAAPALEYGPQSYLPPAEYQSLDYPGSSAYSPYYDYSSFYSNYSNNDDDILRELLPWLLILRNRAC